MDMAVPGLPEQGARGCRVEPKPSSLLISSPSPVPGSGMEPGRRQLRTSYDHPGLAPSRSKTLIWQVT